MRDTINKTLLKFIDIENTIDETSHEYILTRIGHALKSQFDNCFLADYYTDEILNDDKLDLVLNDYDLNAVDFIYLDEVRNLQNDMHNYLSSF